MALSLGKILSVLLPRPAPQTSSPPSRRNSGGPWSTSSVGGPGVQDMTGIGTSARNVIIRMTINILLATSWLLKPILTTLHRTRIAT